MVKEKDTTTENKILNAAEDEFIEKGLTGARMQQIADKAGINKALLHYYYRSKDKLFEVIFSTILKTLIPKIKRIINEDVDLYSKIRNFANEYITMLQEKPHIPGFIIHELGTNPDRLAKIFGKLEIDISYIKNQINEEIKKGNIRDIQAEQLIINLLSLCIFPVIARPLAEPILFSSNKEDYNKMIEDRKTEVGNFIIDSIKIH